MIQPDKEMCYQIFPIIRHWFDSLLLYLFFITNNSTHVCTDHTITSNSLYINKKIKTMISVHFAFLLTI